MLQGMCKIQSVIMSSYLHCWLILVQCECSKLWSLGFVVFFVCLEGYFLVVNVCLVLCVCVFVCFFFLGKDQFFSKPAVSFAGK